MTTDQPQPDAADGRQSLALNYYGELVRRQWEGCLPDVYQQIRDPGAFFAVLGEVIAQRIDEHADHLAGDDPHGEGYLAKVARLTAARDHAKERVLSEYLLLPPDQDRPAVVDRGHPEWAEVDAEQRECLGDPPGEEDRSCASRLTATSCSRSVRFASLAAAEHARAESEPADGVSTTLRMSCVVTLGDSIGSPAATF